MNLSSITSQQSVVTTIAKQWHQPIIRTVCHFCNAALSPSAWFVCLWFLLADKFYALERISKPAFLNLELTDRIVLLYKPINNVLDREPQPFRIFLKWGCQMSVQIPMERNLLRPRNVIKCWDYVMVYTTILSFLFYFLNYPPLITVNFGWRLAYQYTWKLEYNNNIWWCGNIWAVAMLKTLGSNCANITGYVNSISAYFTMSN